MITQLGNVTVVVKDLGGPSSSTATGSACG